MRKNTAKFGPSRTEGNVEMGGGGSAQGANIYIFFALSRLVVWREYFIDFITFPLC